MHTMPAIKKGVTPLRDSSAMEARGVSGKIEKKTMLTGPQSRTMAIVSGPCVPSSCWLHASADELKVPKAKANKKALNAEETANTTTMVLPFCG